MARIVFLGTPDFAVASLTALLDHPEFEVVQVVTQPDRPAGRGQELAASPVKQAAERFGLPVFQPETLRDPNAVEYLGSLSPDMLVVAAFGQILRQPVLELAPHGCVNVHASLLPRWRGAAPIQYALREGDTETGITIMRMDAGLDTGPIILQKAIPVASDETGASLHDKLAALGADILPGALLGYVTGALVPRPQPQEGVTMAPTLQKSHGEIDWQQSAQAIDRQVRAYTPWPGTYTTLRGALLKVKAGEPLQPLATASGDAEPGTLRLWEGDLAVQTGEGLYRLDLIQPAGKKQMTGQAFLAGHPDVRGEILGRS